MFTPASLTLTDNSSKSFIYTPASDATVSPITLTATATGGFSATATTQCVLNIPANDFSLSPSSLTTTPGAPTGNFTVALNGSLSSNETIALSDSGAGGTFTPAFLTFTSAAAGAQTFTYMPAAGSGGTTKTLTAAGSGQFTALHTVSCVVSSGPAPVAVNDPNLGYSPYNWRISGSSSAISQSPGAYFKVGFTGTSVTATFDLSAYGALFGNTALWPKIRWSIDDAPLVTHQLQTSDSTLTLGSSLAAGNHQLVLYFVSATGGYDRWNSVGNAIRLTGLQLDSGASTIAPPLGSQRIVIFGDSITEGVKTTGQTSSGDISNNDSQLGWAAFLGKGFDCEYGQIGYGGLGWTIASDGGTAPPGVAAFFTPGDAANSSWSQYSLGQSRLTAGLFSPAPDMVFVNLGVNDRSHTDAAVTASVTGCLPALRAAAPDAWIFVVYSVTPQNKKSAVLAGFDAYQAAAPDEQTVIIDCGFEDHFNFNDLPTDASGDGIHPAYWFSGEIAARIAQMARTAMGGSSAGGPVSYSRARVANE